jgi:hypothetical protein
MLGKILKYEFKATARIFVLLYPALLLVALINALLLPVDAYTVSTSEGAVSSVDTILQLVYSTITGLTSFAYVILMIGTLLMTLVISVVRFYNLLGKEGYLWLTLPATTDSHILGKLICSLVWFVASVVVMTLSVGLLLMRTGWIESVPDVWAEIVGSGLNIRLWVTLLTVSAIVSWLTTAIAFYAACAIGPRIMKSRLGGSAIAFIIIYCAEQAVTTVALVVGTLLVSAQAEMLGVEALNRAIESSQGTALASASTLDSVGMILLGGSCILSLLFGVVLYVLTRHFMTKKLNLT